MHAPTGMKALSLKIRAVNAGILVSALEICIPLEEAVLKELVM